MWQEVLVTIKAHCPGLREEATAQLQRVPDVIACWERYCDMGDFKVRLTISRAWILAIIVVFRAR
jgi:hypothetical protein